MGKEIGFIGAGNMTNAIIGGILKAGIALPAELVVYNIHEEKRALMRQKGCTVVLDPREVPARCGIVFLAVKPQVYPEVLQGLRGAVSEQTVFVSLAAGISTDYVAKEVDCACRIVRAMPNTPLLLGEGATALCCSENVSEQELQEVASIFRASGMVEFLPEKQMNAIISVNGSSPAYVYLLAKAMADCAERQGINRQTALRLIAQTLIGSAKMLTDSGYTPGELIRMVSSPGGTTLKALEVFQAHGLEDEVSEAMLACTRRAEELGK